MFSKAEEKELKIQFWGGLNAIYFIPSMLLNKNRKYTDEIEFSIKSIIKMFITFVVTCFAWIFFRANSISIALDYVCRILKFNFQNSISYLGIDRYNIEIIPLISLFLVLEFIGVNRETPLQGKYSLLKTILVLFLILILGVFSNQQDFIYFQF